MRPLCFAGAIGALLSLSAPLSARADALTVWADTKATVVGGTSDLFVLYEGNVALGVEGGIELLGIDLFGEALLLDSDQYFFSVNLGFDASFGEGLRLDVGVFTGPVFFYFPKQEVAGGSVLDNLNSDERTLLNTLAGDGGAQAIAMQIDQALRADDELERTAVGWNLGRVRVSLELELLPVLSVGVVAQAGYHYLLDGEEAAAGIRNEAVNRLASERMLPTSVTDVLRRAVGAKPVDTDDLNGINYNAGVFVKLEL